MKTHYRPLVIVLLVAVMASSANAQLAFKEDFEGEQPRLPQLWATNAGEWKVHSALVTNEPAFSGRASFKLDMTITGGSWHYWWLPVRIPFWSPLRFRGRLLCEQHTASLGFGYAVPSAGTQGNVQGGRMVRKDQRGWEEWEADASSFVGMSETGYMQGLAIYIFAPSGGFRDTRVTLYVDDFEVMGDLPAHYEEELNRKLQAIQDEEKQQTLRRSARLRNWARDVAKAAKSSPPAIAGSLGDVQRRLEAFCRQGIQQTEKDTETLGTEPTHAEALNRLGQSLPLLDLAVQSLNNLPAYAGRHGDKPYLVYVVRPTQNLRVLPDGFPVPGVIAAELAVSACRGEFEPASFAITANEDLKQLDVKVSPLRHSSLVTHYLPLVDVRGVKVWWQAGFGIGDVKHPTLTPELLLHDDSFVAVDQDPKLHRNTLKNAQAPQDAGTLQPLDIPKGTTRQFWLTVHVLPKTPSGTYKGSLIIAPANAPALRLPLQVEVYPFDLEEPMLEYAIYYRGVLSPEGTPTIGSEQKSEQQFRAELQNMKEHGVVLPTCYTGFRRKEDGAHDFSGLQRVMELYKQVELTRGPIVVMAPIPFYEFVTAKDEARRQQMLNQATETTKALNEFRKQHGYPPMAFYGIDEASGETLAGEKELFKAIVQAGGMTAVACGWDFFPAVGEWLTRPIIAIGHPECYPKVHARGHKVWIYARPQVGEEAPETYRRSYGLMVWKRGEDGTCDYAYQHGFGASIYDDFDDVSYRDHVFAYPTIDGVIDTVQWEGFREGVDDVRYLTTLLKEMERAKGQQRKAKLVKEAEEWLAKVDIEGDLQALRRQMVRFIMELKRQSTSQRQ